MIIFLPLSLSSGAPSESQTFEYAKTILVLMTSGSPRPDGKILIIGGGIANFTNVAATFKVIDISIIMCFSFFLSSCAIVFVTYTVHL